MTETQLRVNGSGVVVEEDPDTPLLWILRDNLALTGTKFGCGIGLCGACTVHMDGAAVRSCQVTLGDAAERNVVTIEAFAEEPLGRALIDAWVAEGVPQCGYCQPGMIMAAGDVIRQNPGPGSDGLADGLSNICRCGTYGRIKKAVQRTAELEPVGE